MKRRDFLRQAGAGAGAASVLAALPAGAAEAARAVPASQASLPGGSPASPVPDAPPASPERSTLPAEPAPIGEPEFAARRAKAQQLMAEQGFAALFLEGGANLLYFSGIRWGRSERVFGMVLPRSGEPFFVVPAFEARRALAQIGERFRIRTWEEDASPYRAILDGLAGLGIASGRLAVDESARYFIPLGLAAAAPGLTPADASPLTHACRGVKSAHELEIMRYANGVTLETFRSALRSLRPGLTQADLARTIEQAFAARGYEGYALVLFGESSAYPHGLPRPRALAPGDVVLLDGGCTVHGYEADITRTVVFGKPSPEQQRVWDIVRRAQDVALATAAPGRKCGEVDAAARRLIADAGFGPDYRYFTHRLGHGIGLEGHEWPYLVRGSDVVLRPGMTFSNEPGIYQYDRFGVRTEDIMVITETGAELLTPQASSLSPSLD